MSATGQTLTVLVADDGDDLAAPSCMTSRRDLRKWSMYDALWAMLDRGCEFATGIYRTVNQEP